MSPRPVSVPEPEFEGPARLARSGRAAEALAAMRRALAALDDRESHANVAANTLAEIGRAAERAQDLKVGLQAFDLAIELRPRWPDLHFQRAGLLLQCQHRPEARQALDRALEINPRYVAARVERAMLDAREGRVGEALDALSGLAREAPVSDPAAFDQGLRRLEHADWDGADALLRRSLRLSDPELRRRLERHHAQVQAGEHAQALQTLREILPRHAAYPDLHDLIGLGALRLGQLDDALVSFARALELNPDFHAARVHFATTLEALGQKAQAEEQVSLVLERDPGNAQARALRRAWRPRRGRAPAAAGGGRRSRNDPT